MSKPRTRASLPRQCCALFLSFALLSQLAVAPAKASAGRTGAGGGSSEDVGASPQGETGESDAGGAPQDNSCPAATSHPVATSLIYTGPLSAHCGEPFNVSARLADACGNALAGRRLDFNVGARSASATTDANGVAAASIAPQSSSSPLPLTVKFAGDDNYSAAQDSAAIRSERVSTSLRYTGKSVLAAGTSETVSAVLTDATVGSPIPNAVVSFVVGTARSSATTDANGVATANIAIPPAGDSGRSQLKIDFAGDDCRDPASASAEVTTYLQTAFVIWGGNNERLSMGQRVNFWGHSWAKQVSQGDYKAHNDFKGYADTVNRFQLCQTNVRTTTSPRLNDSCWSTKPGQSFPPQTIPEYIGVIVTTSADKSGARDFGNIAALVVVKVAPEPRYGDDPGKPGFGTIFGVIADGEGIFPQPPSISALQTQLAAVLPAQSLSVAVTVANNSAVAATNVSIRESFTNLVPPTAAADMGALPAAGNQTRTFGVTIPPLPKRREDESNQAYQSRLGAAEGTVYSSHGLVSFQDAAGRAFPPVVASSSSTLQLPRLAVGISSPPCVSPGQTVSYVVKLTNLGRATATSAAAVVTFADGTSTRVETDNLEPGRVFTSTVNWTAPAVAAKGAAESDADYLARLASSDGKAVKATAAVTWKDALGNDYGAVDQECASVMRVPILSQTSQPPAPMLPGQRATLPAAVRNAGSGNALQARLRVTNPDGSVFDAPPFGLAALGSAEVPTTLTAPPVAAKAEGETDDQYLARLQAADNRPIDFTLTLEWADAAGNTYGPVVGALRTTEVLPIVTVSLSAPETVEAGDAITYRVTANNVGHAEATGLSPVVTLPDGRAEPVQFEAAALPPGGTQAAVVNFNVPADQPDGQVNARAALSWRDALANGYGPMSADAATNVLNPNRPPIVNAGSDQSVVFPAPVTLNGTASDDGKPSGSTLTVLWTKVSGPGSVTFSNPAQAVTSATFSVEGTYVLRLTASDSVLSASDEATVEVTVPSTGPIFSDTLDFTDGEGVNVEHDEFNHLHLSNQATPFNFIWVAVSSKGTIVKIDTDTGKVIGEYLSSPAGQPKDPSRTTVDHNGNVWASNRAGNSVLRIGLVENGQCVDRNGNGVIDTSSGLGDRRPWTNAGGVDTDGGVETAQDECIINYTRVRSSGTRHVSVNALDDVWVSGTGGRHFDLLDGRTGAIKRQESSVGFGGYGGLIDKQGVIWSARSLLRWDTALPLKGANGGNWRGYGHDSYGLCIDSQGNVWNTSFVGNDIRKFAPDGTLLGTFQHGANSAQGCVVDRNDHVWVAHSTNSRTVGRLKPDGTFIGNVTVGSGPTGVAVDAKGKIWATNHSSRNVSRIDPDAGPMGADGVTRVGQVDFTTVDLGGTLYNYSDMTGSTLSGAPAGGTFTQVFDSGIEGAEWGVVGWNGRVCGDGALLVRASSSGDGRNFSAPVEVSNGVPLSLPAGRYLKVSVAFKRASSGESPFLFNLTVGTKGYTLPAVGNSPPAVDAGSDQTATMPNAANLVGKTCDSGRVLGALAVTWEKVSGPGTVTFGNAQVPATSATFGEPGEYTLRLSAGDSQLSAADEMTVVVLPFNDPPAVNAGPDQSVILPAAASLAGVVSDDALPKDSSVAVSWSKLSGPGEVTFVDATKSDTAVSFAEPGEYVLRLTADDSQLANVDQLTVKVFPPNKAPTVSAGDDQTIRLPDKANLSGVVADDGLPLGKTVAVAWSKVSGPGSVSFAKASAAATTAAFSLPGSYVLRLTVNDSQLSASDELAVVVNPANQPPTVNAGPDQTVTLPDAANLSGSVTDDGLPEGKAVTVAWSKASGPGVVTFGSPNGTATTAAFSEAGTYVLRLTASDSALSRTDDVSVTVNPSPVNLPPNVNAGPDQTITLPAKASLSALATDDKQPAGSTLTLAWSKVSGPGNVTFANATAATTTATFSAAGEYVLRLTASDTALTGADELAVKVLPVNQPPVVKAGVDQIIFLSFVANLSGSVTDDGLPATGSLTSAWSKVSGPGEVTFADASAAATTATFSTGGTYVLRLTAGDGQLSRSDDVSVTVNRGPTADAGLDLSLHLPNAATLKGVVTDDALPPGKIIAIAWSKVSGPGNVTFSKPSAATTAATFTEAGTYTLRLSANDSLLEDSDEVVVTVKPPLPAPPSVAIASPADGAEINSRVDIVGSVSHGSWRLEYSLGADPAAPGSAAWTTIASAATPVANGVLGPLDPTRLLNGTYHLRLTSTDDVGQTTSVTRAVVVAGQQKVGNFSISYEDFNIPVAGLPLQLIRTYDSRDKRVGDFGVGWTLAIKNIRLEKSVALGRYWRGVVVPGFIPQYCLQPDRPNVVTITFPDDRVYKFQATTAKQCQQLAPIQFATFGFTPMPGTKGSLVPEASLDVTIAGGYPGTFELLDSANPRLDTYDPTVFRFTDENGIVFVIDQKLGVRSITDLNGNRLTFTRDGITHSGGKGVVFVRDAQGRIVEIKDPNNASSFYAYDARGDLVSYKDREANETTFAYNSTHDLLTIKDPRGLQPVRNEYDQRGRLVRQIDAFGKAVEFNSDPANRQEVVTDRLGLATVYEYNARGQVVRVTDPTGGVTRRTYDARDNLLSETNARGETTTFTYDANNNRTSQTDPLGNTTRQTYNARGQVLTLTDPRGRVTTSTYDAKGNLVSVKDPLGRTTSATFNTRGQQTSVTDPLGNTFSFAYDAAGNLTRRTDPLGNAMAFTYDAVGNRLSDSVTRVVGGVAETLTTTYQHNRLGRPTRVTRPDGSTTRLAYNSIGKPSEALNGLGRRTVYDYDESGQIIRATYPNGTKEEHVYDAASRLVKSINRAGQATTYTYDALGRVEKVTYPDGTSSTTTHDAARRVTSTKDARGHITTHEYDARGRHVKMTDARGNVTAYTYDAVGNQSSVIDPKGQTTRFEYDELNRRTSVVFPDGTSELTAYDAAGRVASRTDQAGRTTTFEHDRRGLLTKITDALGGVTAYTYDSLGNQLSQTDANNHTTTYEYDRVGRRVRRTLPLGMSETYSYDEAGNLTARTDFNGKRTTYAYDVMDRLLSKTPDPSLGQPAVTFTYTAAGQRASMTDAVGTTTYTYDARDRLTSKRTPHGTLTYTYDAAGSLLTVRSSNTNGVSIDYGYDEMSRLTTVKDNRLAAGTTTYEYDPNGNLAATLYPNGVQTAYTYNALNRLTQLTATKDAPLASYAYTLGPAGNRLSVAELGGRTATYAYDALYRLTGETIGNDPTRSGAISYTYDAVGNRLSRTSTVDGVDSTTDAYDANDRPRADTFDQNGNTLSSGGSTYAYDSENRLTSANGGAVTFLYDGDGNRVAKTAGGVTTRYLVDTNNPTGFAQVVDELQDGVVVRQYTYGHDLISQNQIVGGERRVSFYGYDGHGSTRYLTDQAGAVTDTYTYDAFGVVIARTGTTPNEHLYAGEQRDPNLALDYLRARYMNPRTGRFMTMDAFEGFSADPASLHKYLYASADPVNRIDPGGNFGGLVGLTIANSIRVVLVTIQGIVGNAIMNQIQGGGNAGFRSIAIDIGFVLIGPILMLTARALRRVGSAAARASRFLRAVERLCNCFAAGTPVQTKTGVVPIQKLKAGDEVLSRNQQTGAAEYKKVAGTFTRRAGVVVDINVKGDVGQPIGATPDHPFYARRAKKGGAARTVEAEAEWVQAGKLSPGDFVLSPSGEWVEVARVTRRAADVTVHDLEIANNHNFFVGSGGVLVHNECELFPNRKPHFWDTERMAAERLGVRPLRVGEPGFDDVVNRLHVKWAVDEDGALLLMPKYVEGEELYHPVLTNNRPVRAAGEAHITGGNGVYFLIWITRQSGHYEPSLESLNIGKLAFVNEGFQPLDGIAALRDLFPINPR
jgi:RHS repeat-associated protein/uncharacterized repeat protein (TIGR01451 family)